MMGNSKDVLKDLVPVQIIGTQRSGSNLLRVMLNQLHSVFAPHPPHILKTFDPIARFYGNLDDSDNYTELVSDICEFVGKNPVPWLNSQFDPEIVVKYSTGRSLLDAYKTIHEMNAHANNARFWFNKSMMNVYFIEYFERNGFKPYYIHLIRDGRDVALSFRKTIVGEKHMYHLAKQWLEDQELSNYYTRKFGATRAIRVKYEDLLHQPQQEIQRICRFIGLEYSNNILKFYESKDSKITAESGQMWHNLSKPLMKNNFNKYKKELQPEDIDIFEKVAGKLLTEYGYELENQSNKKPYKFSADQIKSFDIVNDSMKEAIIKTAEKKDLRKRYEQEKLIQRIHSERGVVKVT
jgi:hypothetical protein